MISAELLIDAEVDWQSPDCGLKSEENLQQKISQWLQAKTLISLVEGDVLVVIRLLDEQASRELNSKYREKDKSTNVLSFPLDRQQLHLPDEVESPLGDLAICWRVAADEAEERNISLLDHLAHLSIHGFLHLLGFDHQETAERQYMESVEVEALAALGVADPYLVAEVP